MAYHIAYIGAPASLHERLQAVFSAEGYETTFSDSAAEGLRRLPETRPHLVMLAHESPDMSGFDCLRILRHTDLGKKLPVIYLCERRSDDLVAQAFAEGADDVVLTSCHPAEFLARTRAVLRRHFERGMRIEEELSLGPISLDPSRHECRVGARMIALRRREFDLLTVLMRKAGRVLNRTYLLDTVWDHDQTVDPRTVDVVISRIRRSLGAKAGAWVETVGGYGYRFRDPARVGR
jgi:DNA-binding response OmpR family regulator